MAEKELLSVKMDLVFKLIFGDQRNTDILASFLKSVLDILAIWYQIPFFLIKIYKSRPRKPHRQLNNMPPAGLSRLASVNSSQSSYIRYHFQITISLCRGAAENREGSMSFN